MSYFVLLFAVPEPKMVKIVFAVCLSLTLMSVYIEALSSIDPKEEDFGKSNND